MSFLYKLFIVVFSFCLGSISYSQERSISGFVVTFKKIPVVNAEVKVLSSKQRVFTDSVGYFKLNSLPEDKIKIKAKGFHSEKIKINKNTNEVLVNLDLRSGVKSLELAVGYGHIKDKDKSYSISQLKLNDPSDPSNYTNILQYIADSSPSIVVQNGNIIIRGSSSLLGSNSALILVDGLEVSSSALSNLPPTDVKNIDILKGSSAAIYGQRGANGVVVITTKSGRD